MAADRFGVDTQRHDIAAGQLGANQNEEASQRVGPLVEIPGLLREFGTDPTEVLASVGLDADALDGLENRISPCNTGNTADQNRLKPCRGKQFRASGRVRIGKSKRKFPLGYADRPHFCHGHRRLKRDSE